MAHQIQTLPALAEAALAVGTSGEALAPELPTLATSRGNAARSSFFRHVVIYSFANLLALVANGILTFLLPRWLSMEDYGYYRLFLLYGGFAGVLHMGLLDGVLIRWAARPRQRMREELFGSLIFLWLQHSLVLIPTAFLLFAWFRHQPWFFLVAAILVYTLVWNIATLGQFTLQADKSFVWLSALTVVNPALLLGFVLLAQRGKHLTLESLLVACIASWIVASAALWLVLWNHYLFLVNGIRQVWRIGIGNIKIGWSVLLALLLTNIVLSLDRIVVSVSFSIREFAIYSFAANALAVVNTIILSVSRVVFPYLSDSGTAEIRVRAYAQGEAALMTLWALGLASYFPLRVLIMKWLPAYLPSLPILRLLMMTTGFTATIYILHANYFRSAFMQGRLLFGVLLGLLAAASFLAIARHSGSLTNMAWAILAGVTTWWLANECLLRKLTERRMGAITRTLFFAGLCCIALLICELLANVWLAAAIYLTIATILISTAYKNFLRLPSSKNAWLSFRPTVSEP